MQKNKLQKGMGDTDIKKKISFYCGLGDTIPSPAQKFRNKRKNPVKRYRLRSSKTQESTLVY